MVNQQVLEGHWDEIKGKLRSHWAALTDDDLGEFNGRIDRLVGVIERKTGEARGAIENYLEEILAESDDGEGMHTVRDYARHAADTVQRSARDVGDRAQVAARQVRDSMSDGYAEAEQMVKQRPAESLAVCFGAGLIAGVLVGLVLRR